MRFAWIFIFVLVAYWCSENTSPLQIDPENVSIRFNQVPGCLDYKLSKPLIRDTSCFHYEFLHNLNLEICLPANCCPDSNRFDYSAEVRQDTIFFTVLDTAQQLCDCICNYVIQAKIQGLLRDAYIFQCIYYDEIVITNPVNRQF